VTTYELLPTIKLLDFRQVMKHVLALADHYHSRASRQTDAKLDMPTPAYYRRAHTFRE
jgi:hypothetical protein